jgi:hypothetical protein
VAQGPASSCRAKWRAKGTDPKGLWIPEDVGCCLQEGVLPCSSGMAQGKRLQENLDTGKLWTVEGIAAACRSGTAQGTKQKDDIAPKSPKWQTFGKRRQKGPECKNGIRNWGLRQQLQGSKWIKNLGSRRPLHPRKEKAIANVTGWSSGQRSHLGSRGTLKKVLYEIFRGKKVKQIAGSYVASQKIKDWTLLVPSEMDEEPTRIFSTRRGGVVGTQATWDSSPTV